MSPVTAVLKQRRVKDLWILNPTNFIYRLMIPPTCNDCIDFFIFFSPSPHFPQGLWGPNLYSTSHDLMMQPHDNYVSRALWLRPTQLFSIECLDSYLNITQLTFINSVWLVMLSSYNLFQLCSRSQLRVSPAPSYRLSVCRPAHTCGSSPKVLNPLRIHQWQDGAFLINSVWSFRGIQPCWEKSRMQRKV